ncbi:unnamed protein product [Candidula unifasciata]|uniref:G-protein coupled receptors family 1 profile domain-containing protein n=1 Tax=Candidula unifasciata TaxID=100452 RepID=A0A8S3ZSJ3_9EUPU|nr:unnamed protein product [Candidula unifasciata]
MSSLTNTSIRLYNSSLVWHENINVVAVASFSIVTALLSLAGAGSVLICSIYHRRVFYPEIFPTFHLALADLLASFTLIVSSATFLSETSDDGGAVCAALSGLVTSFYTSAFLLTLVHALEVLLRFRKRLKDGMRLDTVSVSAVSSRPMYLAYAFSWLIPLILAIVIIIKSQGEFKKKQCSLCFADFRFDGESCWNGEEAFVHDMARLVFLIPLVMVMVVNMVLYLLIWRTYRLVVIRSGLLSYHQRQEERLLRRKTCFYQAVFFVCWLPSIVVGYASFTDGYSMYRFYPGLVIQIILGPLQGLLNSIVYGWKRDSFRRALTERTSLLSTDRTTMSVTL